MTPLDAVAAAIRERLLAGQPAPLLGLGTLVRQHVAARVEERADGSRVLLPPGETVGLDPEARAEPSLSLPFARLMAISPDVADRFYSEAIDQIEARLAATGEVRLPGVGLLRRTSGGVVLGVEAELLAAVNRRYEGLAPVPTAPLRAPAPDDAEPEPEGRSHPPQEEPPLPTEEGQGEGPSPDGHSPEDGEEDSPSEDATALADPDDLSDPDEADADVAEGTTEGADDASTGDSEPPEVEELRPLRDLDSAGLAAPFVPPSPDEGDDETWAPPDPDWTPPAVEVVPPSDDLDVLAEEDDPGGPDPEVLAAPFGGPDGPAPADVLPPTPDHRQPPPGHPSEPSDAPSPDDGWTQETWTAPGLESAFGTAPEGLPEVDPLDSAIEDADFDVVDGGTDPPPLSVFAEADPVAEAGSDPFLPPHVVVPSPAVVDAPGAGGAPGADVGPPPRRTHSSRWEAADDPAGRRWVWWALAGLVLALLAAAVWLWPEIGPRLRGEPGPAETITVDAAPTPSARPLAAAVDGDPDSGGVDAGPRALDVPSGAVGRATEAQPGRLPGVPPASPSADPSAPRASRGQAPGPALLPPRVSGLGPADVRALAGRDEPITPRADAWTLVVLSTSSRTRADETHDLYRRAGYRTAVLTSRSGQLRVAVGQYPTRADAVRLLDRLPPQAPADTWPLDLQTL
ncbi:SPOR domain-containing protein [Rubrivirga sp.]|uniref:SPOR domain-containing protein n=1 Tax=Rubrivirga sp. TaxID=1885344 RepID=UPI003B52C7CF